MVTQDVYHEGETISRVKFKLATYELKVNT
jgi:hypothetical protein